MGIKYYKKWIDNESRYQYEERNNISSDELMIEISQEEYETETAKQWKEYLDSLPTEGISNELTYDELLAENAELEKENAALLFQMLTGEVYADV